MFALVSGGKDSMAMLQIVMQHPRFAGIVHIDTMTGVTDTDGWKRGRPEAIATRYVVDFAALHKLPLIVKRPATTYEMLIVRYGFPDAPAHSMMYRYLKERPLSQAKIDARKLAGSTRLLFASGERSGESARRKMHVTEDHDNTKSGLVFAAPMMRWTTHDLMTLLAHNDYVPSRTVHEIGMSGKCGCGSFATPDEYNVINHKFPQQGERIRAWESLVQASKDLSGIKPAYCRWGNAKGKRHSNAQLSFDLCTSCIGGSVNRQLSMAKMARDIGQSSEEGEGVSSPC